MKKAKHELILFLVGILMLAVGLFIFSQRVVVYSSFFSGWGWGGMHFTSGIIMIPFIAGIIWLFASGGSLGSKILTGLGVVFVVVAVILSTTIHLTYISLFEWVIILILIFGGAGFILRVFLGGKSDDPDGFQARKKDRKAGKATSAANEDQTVTAFDSVEKELEEIKKNHDI